MPTLSASSRTSLVLRACQQALLLLLLATALGLGFNLLRADALPLTPQQDRTDASVDPRIDLALAKALFTSGQAVFADARSEEDYRHGHIAGALHLPPDDRDKTASQVLASVPKDAIIIAYCDGEDCELSHDLAVNLRAEGWVNAKVLVNGWSIWKAAGLPTE